MTEYNKQLKEDSVKSQIVIGYYRDKKSSYELSREMGIPARTIQNFLAHDTHASWWMENEDWVDELKLGEAKGKSFVGIGYAGIIQKVVDKVTHLENIKKAKKFYDAPRSALVSGDKLIRIPSQYLEEDVSAEDAEVLDYFVKIMENLEKCQENGILFIGMSQQEITSLIESIRSGVQVFTDKEGNTLCIDEIYEDRLTFKIDEDVKAFEDMQDLMREVHSGKMRSDFILPSDFGKKDVVGKPLKICIIADTQCKPDESLEYMSWIGKYIWDKKPDVVVHIGDHYDFPSLSSYDKGKKSFEGRRLKADIEAGNLGMKYLTREFLRDGYNPRMVFCMGNHEDRFDRLKNDVPELDGFVGTELLPLVELGWEVYPFLKPVEIEGIFFVHFLANPMTGKPYAGTATNQLKTVGRSFVVGHKQVLDVAIRNTLDGKQQIGIINGACYPFDEAYKGYQGNAHFRGITMLHEVKDGSALPMFVSLDYLKGRYE